MLPPRISRDGQELPQTAGRQLCELLDAKVYESDPKGYIDDSGEAETGNPELRPQASEVREPPPAYPVHYWPPVHMAPHMPHMAPHVAPAPVWEAYVPERRELPPSDWRGNAPTNSGPPVGWLGASPR